MNPHSTVNETNTLIGSKNTDLASFKEWQPYINYRIIKKQQFSKIQTVNLGLNNGTVCAYVVYKN